MTDINDIYNETPLKEGWLNKQGGKRKTWKKRWFALRSTELSYYNKKPAKSARPAGRIQLSSILNVEPVANDTKSRKVNAKSRFRIQVAGPRQQYLIEGEGEIDVKKLDRHTKKNKRILSPV
eukprot:TRINITY_DN9947_c0_g1_i1.p1 TRINITY_DN9947_c0_g1~~TRINITY_DN9947_c0_g1_i1.p1  ORF type:complete len:133 (-),score=18.41 TRINITY_DN9947_c0_g1_i1:16-381(-)